MGLLLLTALPLLAKGADELSILDFGGKPDGETNNQAAIQRAMARLESKIASRSLRRALLTPQVNTGSRYRCGKVTFKKEQPVSVTAGGKGA